MRRGFFLSLFILSCVQLLSGLALEDLCKLENQELKVSKHLMVLQERKGPNGSDDGNLHTNSEAEELAAKHYAGSTEKAQKGRGSSGGANVVHRRPTEKSAASVYEARLYSFSLLLSILACFVSQFFPF